MLTLMSSFSILSSGFDRPFFIYLLYLFIYLYYTYFSPKRRYILCNKEFYFFIIDWNISETCFRSKNFKGKKWNNRVIEQGQISFNPSLIVTEIYSTFHVVFMA